MAARAPSLPTLPDDVLTHILRQVPQLERLGSVALVSRRMRSLAVSPALIDKLKVTLYGNTAWHASALLLWLARHGRDVRDLSFRVDVREEWSDEESDDWSDLEIADRSEQGRDLPSVCLAVACMAAPLQRLSVWSVPLPTLAWLPLAAGSLEELTLTGFRCVLDVSLHGLTRLTYLNLSPSDWLPHVRLPPNLLHFRCLSSETRMDRPLSQANTLDRLAKLELWLLRHEGAKALSSPLRSLTSLRWIDTGLDLGWLAQHTWLRCLELHRLRPEAGPGASSLAAALASLCQLTSLKLVDCRCSTDGLPQVLQQLRALQLLRLDRMPPATLLPGPWLAGLRDLAVDALTLLASLPALQAAVGLQRLHVLHSTARQYEQWTGAGDPLAEVADSQWQAMCRWVKGLPQLSRLDLVMEYSAAPLPPALLRGMLAVQRRRPGLAVYCGKVLGSGMIHFEMHGNLDRDYLPDSVSAIAELSLG